MEQYYQNRWLSLWHCLGVDYDAMVMNAYRELMNRYNEPHRKYHNFNHIRHCLAEFDSVCSLASNPRALELAIWYHDAIYEIGATDNEKQSALLADGVMSGFLLPEELIELVKQIIIATEHQVVPESFDAKLMLDIDISNLGDADKFKETNRLVREEYSLVAEDLFASGRSNILESFLKRPRIYLTDYFYKKYEAEARRNIEDSISTLRK